MTPPSPPETIAVIRSHDDITEVFRIMKARLGLTNKFCDDVGEFAEGATDQILGPTEKKHWGPKTFDAFCEMFAIQFEVKVNMKAAARMEEIWEGRIRPIDLPKNKRVSVELIERAKPHVLKACGSAGGKAAQAMRSASHKSEAGRKAARARWRKRRVKPAHSAAGATV